MPKKKTEITYGGKFMKRYCVNDKNVPMTFFYFYTTVRPVLSVIGFIMFLIGNSSETNTIIIRLAEIFIYIYACVGMFKMKYWGYKLNKILLIVEMVMFALLAVLNICFSTQNIGEALGSSLGMIIFNSLAYIYFEKRKYLFDGVPTFYNSDPNVSNNILPIPEGYSIDNDGLPFKKGRIYGWGKEFNVFITANDDSYHTSKCPIIDGKRKTLLHRYTAMKHYKACQYCKPKDYIDDWYIQLSKPQNANQDNSKELLFNHTCSRCGKTFKVKYNMPQGQTTIPNLSVICPQCKSKENIEL